MQFAQKGSDPLSKNEFSSSAHKLISLGATFPIRRTRLAGEAGKGTPRVTT